MMMEKEGYRQKESKNGIHAKIKVTCRVEDTSKVNKRREENA